MLKSILLFSVLNILNANAATALGPMVLESSAKSRSFTTATEEYKREAIKSQTIETLESNIESTNISVINQYANDCTKLSGTSFLNKKTNCFMFWNTVNPAKKFGYYDCYTTLELTCSPQ